MGACPRAEPPPRPEPAGQGALRFVLPTSADLRQRQVTDRRMLSDDAFLFAMTIAAAMAAPGDGRHGGGSADRGGPHPAPLQRPDGPRWRTRAAWARSFLEEAVAARPGRRVCALISPRQPRWETAAQRHSSSEMRHADAHPIDAPGPRQCDGGPLPERAPLEGASRSAVQ